MASHAGQRFFPFLMENSSQFALNTIIMQTILETYFEWRRFMNHGEFEAARISGEKMVSLATGADEGWRKATQKCLGIAVSAAEQVSLIRQEYDELAPGQAKAAEWWVARGFRLMEAGALLEAAGSFERALSLDAQSVSAWCGLGSIKAELEDDLYTLEEALQCFARALEIEPSSEEAWYSKGLALTQAGHFQEALQCYDYILDHIDAEHAGAWLGKGMEMAADRSTVIEALAALQHGFSVASGNREHVVCHGLHLLAIDKTEEALECFEQALNAEPAAEDLLFFCGIARIHRTLYTGAIECFDSILTRLNPDNAAAWHYKGVALKHLNKLGEMKACWAKAAELGYTRSDTNPRIHPIRPGLR